MSSSGLRDRFCRLWHAHGGRDAGPVFDGLVAHYAEPQRQYHTLAHIRRCLRTLDHYRASVPQPGFVELALWCHDVIYRPAARDNEARSADWWQARAGGFAASTVGLVADAILATTHRQPPAGAVAAWTVDIDLAGLALSPASFARDGRRLRAERPELGEAEYAAGERAFLSALLARPRLYFTAALHADAEAQARANLQRRLRTLARLLSPLPDRDSGTTGRGR